MFLCQMLDRKTARAELRRNDRDALCRGAHVPDARKTTLLKVLLSSESDCMASFLRFDSALRL